MRSPTELAEAFRASGRKVTPQRQRIFELLHGDPSHPTAEALHARVVRDMPSVSLRTVYATLHELAEMGELQELALGTGSTRFDPNVSGHHHLVCRSCGRVADVEHDAPPVAAPDATATGFVVEATEIVFRGRCASCVAASTPDPVPGTPSTTN